MDVTITGTITPTCHPDREAFSVKPGEDAVYVSGRDENGEPSKLVLRMGII